MNDLRKTKARLLQELAELRQRLDSAQPGWAKPVLGESELKYRAVFEASTDAIFLETLDGRILDCNSAACKLLGYTRQELLQLSVSDLVPPEVAVLLPEVTTRKLTPGGIFIEATNRRKDGQVFPVEVSTQIVAIDGQPCAIVCVRDITERERAAGALNQRVQELMVNYETSLEINAQHDMNKLLYAIVERAARLIGAPMGGLYLTCPDGQSLKLVVSYHLPGDLTGAVLRFGEGLSGRIAQTGQIMTLDNYQTWDGQADIYQGMPFARVLGVPLKMEDRVIGVLNVTDAEVKDPYREEEIRPVLLLANQAAVAIHNAQLYEAMQAELAERKRVEAEVYALNQDLKRRAEQLELLYDAGLTLTRTLDAHEQLVALSQIAMQALHADNSGFFRYDEARGEIAYEFGVGRGVDDQQLLDLRVPLGEPRGLIGWIAQHGKAFYLPDVRDDPCWIITDPAFRSAFWVPIVHEQHLLGLLSVVSIHQDAFSPADRRLLELFASQVAVALENARLYQNAVHVMERSKTLHWLSQEIVNASLEPERIYAAIYQAALKLMPAEAFVIALWDDTRGQIDVSYSIDRGQRFPSRSIPRGEGISSWVIDSGKSLLIRDLEAEGHLYRLSPFGEQPMARSILAVPMRLADQVLGVISTQSYQPSAYTHEDADLLDTLAAYAAIALQNERLFSQMQTANVDLARAYEATIEGWSRALEMRDKETKGHSERVTRITVRLARWLGFNEEQLLHLRRGVLLHDIGKMVVPDYILLKPSSLTDEEWLIMRQHPTYAYQMLNGIPFLSKALDIPYCHHEKWNGAGYPRGLQGEQIPLGARIFAVVDVWDALTSDRPYHPAWTRDAARGYIHSKSGIQFDPQVVKAFMDLLEAGELY